LTPCSRPSSTTSTLDRLDVGNAAAGDSYDEAQAFAQGWGVFDCGYRDDGSRLLELQRIDSPAFGTPRFQSDDAAWRHVAAAAAAGSRLHAVALASFDPVERLAIEAACGWCPGL
jgi:hypothetical protein